MEITLEQQLSRVMKMLGPRYVRDSSAQLVSDNPGLQGRDARSMEWQRIHETAVYVCLCAEHRNGGGSF
jgi:hypothetical protein